MIEYCFENQLYLLHMKKINEKSAFYCPPEVKVFAVTTEGVLCSSQHEGYQPYEGNDQFDWEE